MKQILELLNIPMLMEATRFAGFLHGYRALPTLLTKEERVRKLSIEGAVIPMALNQGYVVSAGGIAVVPIMGAMFKGYGGYGYADQSELRGTIRQAASDSGVSGIMLLIDSPGGSVAGTADLAAEIKAADAIKPVMAYIEDCGCSAAYWIAAACREIYSNGGIVGSIGVVTSLVDSSKYFENAGIKVIPIVTGEMKAAGMEGTPVTPAQVAYVQDLIDTIYGDFVNAVTQGRGMRAETVRKMEAKVFVGQAAVENKLINGVCTLDVAAGKLAKAARAMGVNKRAKAKLALLEMGA